MKGPKSNLHRPVIVDDPDWDDVEKEKIPRWRTGRFHFWGSKAIRQGGDSKERVMQTIAVIELEETGKIKTFLPEKITFTDTKEKFNVAED